MTAISVQPPYPIFADANGQPLEDGYIWIGQVGLPPIANQISIYWDITQTIPAAQPIRTQGGYPVNSGTPARFYVGSDYSIQVLDKNGSVIYSSLNDNLYSGGGGGSIVSNATGNGVQTIFPLSFIPSAIYINGVYQNQNTYSVSGGSVNFTQAPPLNTIIEFVLG